MKIASIVLSSVIILLGTALILLNTSKVQNYIVQKVTSSIKEKSGIDLQIGSAKVTFSGAISLENILLNDKNDEPALQIGSVDLRFSPLKLIKGDISLSSLSIDQLDLVLIIDSAGVLNLQPVIDKLNTGKGMPTVALKKIALKNSSVRVINESIEKREVADNILNYSDIYIHDIKTLLSLSLDKHTIDLDLTHLEGEERSGLKINDLTTHFIKQDSLITLPQFSLKLPNSNLVIDSLAALLERDERGKIALDKSTIHIDIPTSKIAPTDLGALYQSLYSLRDNINLELQLDGKISDLNLGKIDLSYGENISLAADGEVQGLPDWKKSHFRTNIDHISFNKSALQDLIANITARPFKLPDLLTELGNCSYGGTLSGYISDFVLYGHLNSAIGSINTDFGVGIDTTLYALNVDGKIHSEQVQLAKILPKSGLGDISFYSTSKIKLDTIEKFDISTDLNIKHLAYKTYDYRNIAINGNLKRDIFQGDIEIDDPNGALTFNGLLAHKGKEKQIKCKANVRDVSLNKLQIINTLPNFVFSFNSDIDVTYTTFTDLIGELKMDSIILQNGAINHTINAFSLTAEREPTSAITIQSDIINGGMMGEFDLPTLPADIMHFTSQYIPTLLGTYPEIEKKNKFTIDLAIEPLEELCKVLDIKWYTTLPSHIYAKYQSDANTITSTVNIPHLTNGKMKVDSIDMLLSNRNALAFYLRAKPTLAKKNIDFNLSSRANDDVISTTLRWDNKLIEKIFAGEIIASTTLNKNTNGHFDTRTIISPTEFQLSDMTWKVSKSLITTTKSLINISNLVMSSSNGQRIAINGEISPSQDDFLDIELEDIILDYITDLLPNKKSVSFGGRLSGNANIAATLSKEPQINAQVLSENFVFDGVVVGDITAACNFDNDSSAIDFNGVVTNSDFENDSVGIITGGYYFKQDSLDLKGHANGLTLRFLDFYLKDIFGTVDGKAYGDVWVHGKTKKPSKVAIDVAGYAEDASVTVDFLNSTYYFSDSVFVSPQLIDFGEIDIQDKYGSKGKLSGGIKHNYFEDVKMDLTINVEDMLVFNTTREQSSAFYGTAYATGVARITSNPEQINIEVKAQTQKGTKLYVPFDSYNAAENSFIVFQDYTKKQEEKPQEVAPPTGMNLYIDLMMDITPEAELQLQVDTRAGDMLYCTGEGNVRVTYDLHSGELNMYGPYTLQKGGYLFTFQSIIRKEFQIKQGSTLLFSGNPLASTVNIDAYHQLTADIADVIDAAVLENTSRTSVPVQCLLNLSGQLTQPTIKFDLNLPNSEEELNRALHNVLNTEEQINRQIISLLLLGKFISPESLANSQVFSQNELYSVVSSTLSAQLNNWASQMFDKWGFGVNFRTTGEGDTRSNEYEFNFMYNPIDRLTINGNVGYRDDAMSATNFIGDFDVEYDLTQSGRFKLKGYTHTNDYREFKTGLTTQGVGVVYSENFYDAKDLRNTWKQNRERYKREQAQRKERRAAKKEAKRLEKEAKKQQKEAAK